MFIRDCRGRCPEISKVKEGSTMGLILLVLILAILFGGLGFALHALWWVAAIVIVAWLIGFIVRLGEGRHWYYW
jgi:membrane protein YdbS with pleckstrin-like domain